MLKSEKKSLFRFLVIYMITTMTLFTLAAVWFYSYQMHSILDVQHDAIKVDSELLVNSLRKLHESDTKKLLYPITDRYKSAIYDIDKNYIFGDFKPKNLDLDTRYQIRDRTLLHIQHISPHYLGCAYLVIKKDIDKAPLRELLKITLIFMFLAFLIFLALGYYLGRLFIAPMRDNFQKLNNFIQDTTHELNTPISTILTNIELLDTLYECDGKKERKRIEIASKTLSRLYDDLTYLKLSHKHHRDIKSVDISKLVYERIIYFSSMIEAKKIELVMDIKPDVFLMIDENDAIRFIDNLLSNAIKYNKPKGNLDIKLALDHIVIQDSGIGMSESELEKVFDRFERSNDSEGGFGIGMDIVDQVVKYYDYKIEIKSKKNQGTKVSIRW